jgi:hypothetical protein
VLGEESISPRIGNGLSLGAIGCQIMRPIPLMTAAENRHPAAIWTTGCVLDGKSAEVTSGLVNLTIAVYLKSRSTVNKLPLSAKARQLLLPTEIRSIGSTNGINSGVPRANPANSSP